jgi:multiple sugar transport system ATP-binding protein
MQNGIEIRKLTKRFGHTEALKNVDLFIHPNHFVALLGPSGCGKTTLLRCIAGLETPDAGEILVGGRTVFSSTQGIDVPPGQRGLGMVFQSYALWPHMKVRDNVGFGLELQGVSKAARQQRVEKVLSEVGLEGLGDRYPSELSGGQQQRVALARLLATRPAVFLMDEPLSNLDARLRMDMRAELKRLHREGSAATVYVTHDQGEAMTMADQVVVMSAGTIQQISGPAELYRRPSNVFVAEFIGMPRMNLLPARSVKHDGSHALQFDDFSIPIEAPAREGALIVGARPEDVRIVPQGTPGAADFGIAALLPAGSELIIQLRRGETVLYAREDHRAQYAVDERVGVMLAADSINLFDEKTGLLV